MKTFAKITFTTLLFFAFITAKSQETKPETKSDSKTEVKTESKTEAKTEVKQEDKAKQEGASKAEKKSGKKSVKKEPKKGSPDEKIAINEKGKPGETTKSNQSTTTAPKKDEKANPAKTEQK